MSDTPETDDIARGNHVVPTEWAQQLERERDEARNSSEAFSALAWKLEGERNEAREKAERYRIEANAMMMQRDEARGDLEHWKIEYEIVVSRLCGIKHERDNGIIAENEIIPVLRKELDEARLKIKSQADRIRYLEGATNHACGTPLSVALRERDEARQALMKIEDLFIDGTYIYADREKMGMIARSALEETK